MKMTLYLIYRPEDCLVLQSGFATEKAATLALQRKWRRYPTAKVSSENNFYQNIDHDVEVRGLEDGRIYTIRASEVDSCVDPSTERYWDL